MWFISELPPNADIKLFYLAAVEDKETLERELKEAKVMFRACLFYIDYYDAESERKSRIFF